MTAAAGDLGELGRLLDTFNQATEKLAGSYRRIEDLQKELAEKNRRLAQQSRLEMLGRMAAGLAHEIRNPLGGIQLFAGMLRRDLQHDAEKVKTLDRILGAVAGLEKLVADMLAFGRDVEPQKSLRSLGPVLDEAVALASRAVTAKHIHVVREGAPGEADLDVDMLVRVFLNLILNACEAMEPGGTLRVSFDGRSVALADSGPGIPAEVMDKLFTPFVTSKAKGTGLGLAIAHKIVEAHGGSLEAANAPGGGAVFTVKL